MSEKTKTEGPQKPEPDSKKKEKKNNEPYVLIMAGGSGTRLWPLSTESQPKQLLNLYSSNSLIEETINRALLLTKKKRIFIGTNANLKKRIQRQIVWLKNKNFIVEPLAKNTAPIIALFSAWLKEKGKDLDRPILVLSADHYIEPAKEFKKTVQSVLPEAHKRIWCIGIKPPWPDTGYGYIETGEQLGTPEHHTISSFKEKPELKQAEDYISAGNYYWNAGMFIFTANLFLSELNQYAPEIVRLATESQKSKKALKKNFKQMPDISVDYALLEKTQKLGMVKASFKWDDVGSFNALKRILPADKNKNYITISGTQASIKAEGNIVFIEKRRKNIALLGVNNLVIAEKDNVLLIADQNALSDIKEIREEYLKQFTREDTNEN